MTKFFSFNFNTNFSVNGKKVLSSKASDKQDLTAQQEYWLNRMLREYGGKAYGLIALFLIFLGVIVFI